MTRGRVWTKLEDEKLVEALMELHASGKYAGVDNGIKSGYFQAVESLLAVSIPESNLKAEPNIKSRLKTLRKNFNIVHDMLVGTNTSGFGWDPVKCCVTADDQVWEDYNKAHKDTIQWKDKPFPFYEKLSIVFGKDRATGARAIDLGDDDVANVPMTNESIDVEDEKETKNVEPNVTEGGTSKKRKRAKSADFDRTYMESTMMLNTSFTTFGNTLSTDIRAVVNDGTSSVDLMKKVVNELGGLRGITLEERLIAMDVIGNSSSRAEMLFSLDEAEKVCMVQMVARGTIGGSKG